jgi:hypothetical protein
MRRISICWEARLAALMVLVLVGLSVENFAAVEPLRQPELRRELLKRREVDQGARRAYLHYLNKVGANADESRASQADRDAFRRTAEAAQAIDRENTAWLKQVVAEHGWPTRSMVGDDGSNAAWLLVQHADADPAFQRECLDLMTRLSAEEVLPMNVAYLTDRVLLAEGKKQVYGTQFAEIEGKQQPRPLEDPEHVDERRAEVGLPSLEEYTRLIEQTHGGARK